MRPLYVVLAASLVLVLRQAFELVLEKEYATWAPALARFLVWTAGLVYWPRRRQWRADLRYVQQAERQSGLLQAGWCLMSAPGLALRRLLLGFCVVGVRQWEKHPFTVNSLLAFGVVATLILGPMRVWILNGGNAYLAFSPDGKTIATGWNDTVRLWEESSGRLIKEFSHAGGEVEDILFSPDGGTLATTVPDGTVQLWEVTSGKLMARFPHANLSTVTFSPNGKTLVTESDGTVQVVEGDQRQAHRRTRPNRLFLCGLQPR